MPEAALDLTDCVVTLDALNTQTAIAEQIVQAKADCLLPVNKKTEVTVRYFISSWSASAQAFLAPRCEQCQIEYGLHWVLNVAFQEDVSRVRKDHAPKNLAVLRRMALNLLSR